MTYTLRARPPYSQIMMRDPSAKVEVPEWKKGVPFVATDTCILYGCYPDMDGETQITVGTADQIDADSSPVFDGMLRTPGHKIVLQTVEGDLILEVATIGDTTPVRVWANRNWLPDIVTIGID